MEPSSRMRIRLRLIQMCPRVIRGVSRVSRTIIRNHLRISCWYMRRILTGKSQVIISRAKKCFCSRSRKTRKLSMSASMTSTNHWAIMTPLCKVKVNKSRSTRLPTRSPRVIRILTTSWKLFRRSSHRTLPTLFRWPRQVISRLWCQLL